MAKKDIARVPLVEEFLAHKTDLEDAAYAYGQDTNDQNGQRLRFAAEAYAEVAARVNARE